jgi:hypothetical protein
MEETVQKSHKQVEPMNGCIDTIQAHRPAKLRHFYSSLSVEDGIRLPHEPNLIPPILAPAGETAARLSMAVSTIEFAVNRPDKSLEIVQSVPISRL